MDKKQLAEAQRNFALHVGLIMHQERVTKSKATFMAWLEGPGGLARRAPSAPAPQPSAPVKGAVS